MNKLSKILEYSEEAEYWHARQTDPDKYTRIRHGELSGGVHVVYGVPASGGSEIQAYLFPKDKFSKDAAQAWLKRNGAKTTVEEEAASWLPCKDKMGFACEFMTVKNNPHKTAVRDKSGRIDTMSTDAFRVKYTTDDDGPGPQEESKSLSRLSALTEASATSYGAAPYGVRKDSKEIANAKLMKSRGYTVAVLFYNGDWDNMYAKDSAQAKEMLNRDHPGVRHKIVPIDYVIASGQIGTKESSGLSRLSALTEGSTIKKRTTTWPDGTVQTDEDLTWDDGPAGKKESAAQRLAAALVEGKK